MARKPGAGGIIALAVILGLVTAYFIWDYLRDVQKQARENWKPVVVAAVDIKPRAAITRDMVTLTRFPEDHIAEDALTDPREVEGKITMTRIRAKEQIRGTDLIDRNQMPSLAYEVPTGKRAIAIAAGEVMAVGSSIRPGDHVDVMATYHDPVAKQNTTKIILQNVPVLAINKGQTDPSGVEGASTSMTLAVTPDEAELLAAADREGMLRVMLRSVDDDSITMSSGITVRDLGGRKVLEPIRTSTNAQPQMTPIIISPPPSRERTTITIIRGTEEKEVTQ